MTEQDIFLAAVDIQDLDQRAAYLTSACASDPALRQQVDSLLAAHERSGEFLDVPALRQMAAGNPGGETSVECRAPDDERDLSFLEPATVPGSIGRLRHYEVQEVIGRGGCGIVLKAFDEKLHRVVAIKVMAPELAATSPARKRFLREARATAAIRHENVVSVHAVEEQPLPFLVMEYIDGQTLQQKLDQTGPLDVREVLRIGRQIANGLEAAHAKGLIHRDIKPGNILLEVGSDHIKITDFGLARSADDASMTQSGVIAGTPLYMSPEQAQGRDIDQRSDLFSLGSVLYVMCSGRPPFRAATSIAVLRRVVEEQPRPIQGIIPEVPQWLAAIITRLHAKNPEERFTSAKETGELLARCQSELQQHGHVESMGDLVPMMPRPTDSARQPIQDEDPRSQALADPAPEIRPARHRRWIAAAAIILLLLTGLGMTEATGVTNVRGTVVRLFSPEGTLVVEVDDPGVSVTIDGEEMVITGTGAKEIRLKPGQYKLLASRDGQVVRQELVTVTTHARQVVRVSMETAPKIVTGDAPQTAHDSPPVYTNALGMEFALVPTGKAWLGGGGGTVGDKEVEFQDDFYLGVYEVTQEEWEKVMAVNNSYFSHHRDFNNGGAVKDMPAAELKRFPVDTVNWEDAQAFLLNLNLREKESGWVYRLPTEDEWEYACRGGPMIDNAESAFDFYLERPSTQLLPDQANCSHAQALNRTCKVGGYRPNRLGLFDMHGNVMEWCHDALPPDPENPNAGPRRVLRGGCWSLIADFARAGRTGGTDGSFRHNERGLRVARVRAADPDRRAAKWVLSVGGTIAVETNGDVRWITAVAELPPERFRVREVKLGYNRQVTEASLEPLDELTGLKQLYLERAAVSGVGLAGLGGLQSVEKLELGGAGVTDEGLQAIAGLQNLRILNLRDVRATDAGIKALARMQGLKALVLSRVPVTDAGVNELVVLRGLTALRLDGTAITDQCLGDVGALAELSELRLDSTRVTSAGLKELAGLEKLRTLGLRDTAVTDEGLESLLGCRSLTFLDLDDDRVSDAGLLKLSKIATLSRLLVRNTDVTESGLKQFAAALPNCKVE
jgi:serine/threonine protein kinase/formylglycine-generating enzyme required for sulfatase activity